MEIVPTSQTVDMCDDPATVFRRKKDTSMGVGLTMLRDGKADAMVSAGSTGALLTGDPHRPSASGASVGRPWPR